MIEELGRGGMGVVFLARNVELNRTCVLKMILGGAFAGEAASANFAPRRKRSPACTTLGSSRSIAWAAPTGYCFSSSSMFPAAA